eukprot:scaffold7705_cov110-Skeletonema_marinoi.AAC.2
METSSAYLLAEWMGTQKVPLTENDWVQLMEKHLEQLMVGLSDGDELGLPVGLIDGDAEGLADGSYEAVTEGLDDGAAEFSTHSRWPAISPFSRIKQHLAILQISDFLGFLKHSEINASHDAL